MTSIALAPSTGTATRPTGSDTIDLPAVAAGIVADRGGRAKPDLSAIKRDLDAVAVQDPALAARVRAEIERLLTPVQVGQLARATYVVGGVTIDPNAKTVAEQFAAPIGSADHRSYAALDRMFGDGNWRTDDSVRITRALNDLTTSGLSLAELSAKGKANDATWEATAGDFLASLSLGGRLAEAARPAIAALARDAGLGGTEWGASLQRVLDTPGTITAFNAGATQGFIEGGKDFVVTLASLAGRLIRHSADVGIGGFAGDAVRAAVPDGVKAWLRDHGAADVLNEALPSYRRGEAANASIGKAGAGIAAYFASHSAEQIATDVKAKIGQLWDSVKADHASAVAKGPEAEARWWGRVVGRATFEVASLFVPVAGVAGKVGKGATATELAIDAVKTVEATTDAVRVIEAGTDAAKAAKVAEIGTDAAKVIDHGDVPANVARHVKLVEVLRTTELANPLVESLRTTGKLPSNFVTKADAIAAGWKPGKAIGSSIPGAQIGGDIFENTTRVLAEAPGRVWYEADVGLSSAVSRAKQPGTRLLYSSDGLLAVTADHYESVSYIGRWK